MKKFLIKVALYGLVVLTVTTIVVALKAPKYWSKRIPIQKSSLIPSSQNRISLVLGSSHALFGVNTRQLGSNVYNMASISQSLYEDFEILKYSINKKQVDYVILPLSFFTNFHRLEASPVMGEALRIYDYERAYGFEYPRNIEYYKNKITLLGQISKAIFEGVVNEGRIDSLGNLMLDCRPDMDNNLSDSVHAFRNHDKQRNFSGINPLLDSIVNLCNRNKVKLYVVVFPFSSGYLRQVQKYAPEFEGFLQEIKAYSFERFDFLDCRYFFAGNEPKNFKDADHLSACGREIFSRYLASVVKKP